MMRDACSPPQARPQASDGMFFVAGQADMAGKRLDYSLRLLLPQLGVRERKRCIDSGLVLVNGRPSTAAYRLRADDIVSVAQGEALAPSPQPQTGGAAATPEGTTAGMGIVTLALYIFGKIDTVEVPLWVKFACAGAMFQYSYSAPDARAGCEG